jgi:hypothetical protein
MKKIIWNNSSTSGLCDRLIDLHLMSALAKVLDSQLYLDWKEAPEPNEFQKKTWPVTRYSDYKVENFTKYFNLPKNINFVNDLGSHFDSKNDSVFPHYLGGVLSAKTFYERFCTSFCSFEEYEKAFNETTSEFTAKQSLLDVVGTIPRIDLAVHLRRGDKVTDSNPDFVQLHKNSILELENNTRNCFLKEKNKISHKPVVFICSDSLEHKKNFIAENCNDVTVIDLNINSDNIESTYTDLYLLSQSKLIILSQKHSNFSIFSSLIGKNKLIYFYKDNEMITNGKFDNYELYSEENK